MAAGKEGGYYRGRGLALNLTCAAFAAVAFIEFFDSLWHPRGIQSGIFPSALWSLWSCLFVCRFCFI